jgi:hypothetical protein
MGEHNDGREIELIATSRCNFFSIAAGKREVDRDINVLRQELDRTT